MENGENTKITFWTFIQHKDIISEGTHKYFMSSKC